MKKMFSLALALIMALALSVPAFAAEDATAKTITIANSESGQTYTAYKVFDLTKTADGTGYAYTIDDTDAMFDLVLAYMEQSESADAAVYENDELKLTKSTEGNKWNVENVDLDAVAFAQYLNEADLDDVDVAGSVDAVGEGAEIEVIGAGYYFVDSSLGSLCALDTADEVTIYEKNALPSIQKFIQEDSTEEYGKVADLDFTQIANYKLIVNTGTSTDNTTTTGTGVDEDYVIVDTLPGGVSFNDDVAVEGWDAADFSVNSENTGDETLVTITLKAAKVASLGEDADIVITYSAKVASNAVVAGNGNVNTVELTYKDEVSEDSAMFYTWQIPVFKYTGDEKTPLADAVFNVKKGDEVMLFDAYEIDGTPAYAYNPGRGVVEEITTDENGKFIITGLDSDTYTLTELVAPAGYNVLPAPITIVVDDEGALTQDGVEATEIGVLNNTGTELPSTGGVGTTIFYVVGGLMMAAAGVLLVTKKKVANEEE